MFENVLNKRCDEKGNIPLWDIFLAFLVFDCSLTSTFKELNIGIWTDIQKEFPSTAPVNLGSIGYDGKGGAYISAEVIAKSYQAEGLPLEFYRSYDASWHQPGHYFDRIAAVNTSDLKPCNETALSLEPEYMKQYANMLKLQEIGMALKR